MSQFDKYVKIAKEMINESEKENSIIEIQFTKKGFIVTDTIDVGSKKTQIKWKPHQLRSDEKPYGYTKIGIESWDRCRNWLKTNHPKLWVQ